MDVKIQTGAAESSVEQAEPDGDLFYEPIAGWTRITQLLMLLMILSFAGMMFFSFSCASLLSRLSPKEAELAALTKKAQRFQLNRNESHRRSYLQDSIQSDSRKLVVAARSLKSASFLGSVAAAVTALAVLAWVYKAYSNLKGFGETGLTYSPLVAVLLLLVPLYGLWVLYVLLEELWRRSSETQPGARRPANTILQVWLVLTCLATVGGLILLAVVAQGDAVNSTPIVVANCEVALGLVVIVERLLLLWIIGGVHEMQAQRMALYE
jgi:hypothetical protein